MPRRSTDERRGPLARRQGRATTRAAQRRPPHEGPAGTQEAGPDPTGATGRVSGRMWLAGLAAVVLGAALGAWLSGLPWLLFDKSSVKDDLRSGPDLGTAVAKVQLDDEGMSRATREDHRPDASLRRFLARPMVAASPEFDGRLAAVGAVNVDKLTVRVVFTSRRSQLINIIDITPEIVKRERPWSGTLFDAPPQGGSPTMNMMFDLDRPRPLARDAGFDEKRNTLAPGKPFFAQRTISLLGGKQQVVLIRTETKRHYVAFRLKVTYMLGDRTKTTVIDDRGSPFRLTALNGSQDRKNLKYPRVYEFHKGFSLCQTRPASKDCG
ncbi:hypothetical protein [Streptomyces sp. NPDC059816]|uniref:hypothetical protein n=1 Tax=Streptomyces sp. NPDC059816 TaxID=3346960 RepID=UPI003657BA57